jgi:hypothetical protein
MTDADIATATAECGKPGHPYPCTPRDQVRLMAGPGSEEFVRASMEARCPEHAPDGIGPAAYFAANTRPCQATVFATKANGPYETERDAMGASLWHTLGRDAGMPIDQANLTNLGNELFGIELGAYDERILEWLADYEPSTVAVICGLISRARAAGRAEWPATEAVSTSDRSASREALGRVVRDAWIKWAEEQPDPKPSWLVPWEALDAGQRDVDMRIAEAIAAAARAQIFGQPLTQRFEMDDCVLRCAGCYAALENNRMAHKAGCSELHLPVLLETQ